MSRGTKAQMRMLNELYNEELRFQFRSLGDGRRDYTRGQREYVFGLVDIHGVRGTCRILHLPRRTIQRWCRQYGKQVRRCPPWVHSWAGGKKEEKAGVLET